MQVIVETGSKQYLVGAGDEILVEKLKGKDGDSVLLENVLLAVDGDKIIVGRPVIEKATVTAMLLKQEEKGPKRIIFKYKRRKHSKRKIGHRQKYSRIKIEKISL